jgi:anaerobic ribonucleoside-triphosphate reductase activating protein
MHSASTSPLSLIFVPLPSMVFNISNWSGSFMFYHKYYPIDVVNGPGTRCTLFVSGCEHQCRGCYNQSTWRVDSGNPFTTEMADRIIADLNDNEIKRRGLTLSGGDPLHPANQVDVLALVQRVRAECPDKDIWMWTGYLLPEMSPIQQQIVSLIDVLIDGKFEESLADPSLLWRGSSNQIVHYLR